MAVRAYSPYSAAVTVAAAIPVIGIIGAADVAVMGAVATIGAADAAVMGAVATIGAADAVVTIAIAIICAAAVTAAAVAPPAVRLQAA